MSTAARTAVSDLQFRDYAVRSAIVGAALVALAVFVIVAAHPVALPVEAHFLGAGQVELARVQLGVGVVVLALWGAAFRFAPATPAFAARSRAGLTAGRSMSRWIEYSQVSAIAVFLIAQLNGIAELGTLVALYAITAASTIFLALHERGGSRMPFVFGAAVGIVPWGIIAFYQVGASVASHAGFWDAVPLAVRIITIGELACAAAAWVIAYRAARGLGVWRSPLAAERAFALITALMTLALALPALSAA